MELETTWPLRFPGTVSQSPGPALTSSFVDRCLAGLPTATGPGSTSVMFRSHMDDCVELKKKYTLA